MSTWNPIVFVMRSVLPGESQVGIRRAEGFVKQLAHGVEVYQRYVFFFGSLPHGLRVVAQAVGKSCHCVAGAPAKKASAKKAAAKKAPVKKATKKAPAKKSPAKKA